MKLWRHSYNTICHTKKEWGISDLEKGWEKFKLQKETLFHRWSQKSILWLFETEEQVIAWNMNNALCLTSVYSPQHFHTYILRLHFTSVRVTGAAAFLQCGWYIRNSNFASLAWCNLIPYTHPIHSHGACAVGFLAWSKQMVSNHSSPYLFSKRDTSPLACMEFALAFILFYLPLFISNKRMTSGSHNQCYIWLRLY